MISHVPYGAYTEIENVQWWDEYKHEKIFSFIRPLEISVSMARDPRSSRCTVESSVPSFKSEGEIPTISSESFRAYGSVAFGAFMLCHYHFYRVSKCFHHSKRKPHTHQVVALPLPLETTHGLSVSRLTCFGGISYQWNHRLYIHCAWLLSLSMTFGFLPCQSTYWFFTPFHGWVTPRCVYPSRSVYPLIRWWIRGASLWLQWPVLLGTLVYR